MALTPLMVLKIQQYPHNIHLSCIEVVVNVFYGIHYSHKVLQSVHAAQYLVYNKTVTFHGTVTPKICS